MHNRIALLLLGTALAVVPAAAQNNAPATGAQAPATGGAAAPSQATTRFVEQATHGNMFEIETSQIGRAHV